MIETTDIEKIVLQAAATQTRPDWELLYKLSHPTSKAKDFSNIVSRWKNSARIKNYFDEVCAILEARTQKRIQEELQKTGGGNEPRKPERGRNGETLIDYSDPAQQRRKLNELVNAAEDSREALDALKTIISTQKDDREAARERKTIQSYLPLRCNSCPLYLEHKKTL